MMAAVQRAAVFTGTEFDCTVYVRILIFNPGLFFLQQTLISLFLFLLFLYVGFCYPVYCLFKRAQANRNLISLAKCLKLL